MLSLLQQIPCRRDRVVASLILVLAKLSNTSAKNSLVFPALMKAKINYINNFVLVCIALNMDPWVLDD